MRSEERRYVLTGELMRDKVHPKYRNHIGEDSLVCRDLTDGHEFGIAAQTLDEIKDDKMYSVRYVKFPDGTAEILKRREYIIINS